MFHNYTVMANQHNILMKEKYSDDTTLSIQQSKIYDGQDAFLYTNHHYSKLKFVNLSSAHAAVDLKEKYFACKIALLNFADYLSPGGRYLQGATAQEEILCHQSNLYQIISNFNKYYEWDNQHINYHLYRNRAIYSPNVVFTNLDGTLINTINVITCAAPYYREAQLYNISYEEACMTLKNRMYFVKNIAEDQQIDYLVLGAWGAGAFGFSSKEVAKMWHDVFSHPSSIKEVDLAVIDIHGSNNAQIFKSEFSN